jgi:hypothetical protein
VWQRMLLVVGRTIAITIAARGCGTAPTTALLQLLLLQSCLSLLAALGCFSSVDSAAVAITTAAIGVESSVQLLV